MQRPVTFGNDKSEIAMAHAVTFSMHKLFNTLTDVSTLSTYFASACFAPFQAAARLWEQGVAVSDAGEFAFEQLHQQPGQYCKSHGQSFDFRCIKGAADDGVFQKMRTWTDHGANLPAGFDFSGL